MRASQQEAFVAFADAASPRLLTTAWFLTGDAAVAEELVQETLTRMYVVWTRRKVARSDPTAYARRVLVNLNIDRWRRRRREVVTDTPPETEPLRSPASASGAAGAPVDQAGTDRVDLVRALQQLPERERQVVVLRFYADLSERQVADELAVSLGTVKSSGSRGLARLRDLMSEGDEEYAQR